MVSPASWPARMRHLVTWVRPAAGTAHGRPLAATPEGTGDATGIGEDHLAIPVAGVSVAGMNRRFPAGEKRVSGGRVVIAASAGWASIRLARKSRQQSLG